MGFAFWLIAFSTWFQFKQKRNKNRIRDEHATSLWTWPKILLYNYKKIQIYSRNLVFKFNTIFSFDIEKNTNFPQSESYKNFNDISLCRPPLASLSMLCRLCLQIGFMAKFTPLKTTHMHTNTNTDIEIFMKIISYTHFTIAREGCFMDPTRILWAYYGNCGKSF